MSLIKLMAVGDIFLRTPDSRHPFKDVRKIFENKDILFGNLETVLSNQGKKAEKSVLLYSSSDRVSYLKDAGFDVLNIANNHIMDVGVEGFHNTLKTLHREGLAFIGASNKPKESYIILEKQGIKIGFLGYTQDGFNLPERSIYINKIETTNIMSDIGFIKPQCDFVVVSLHWGIENVFYPSPKQVDLAHRLIDAGAAIILGHHSHVIQGVERYKHGLIAYSLGNFQFDPVVSQTKTNKSMILSINFNNNRLKSYDIIPIEIDKNLVPKMSEGNRKAFIDLVNNLSRPIVDGTLTEKWWFEEIAKEYLSGSMKSWIIRIRRYGIRHLLRCIRWLVSPFCIKCYLGMLRRLKEN